MSINYKENGLIPAVCQDANSGQVLMLGYMDPEALRRTLRDQQVWFYSRSRQELWHKGETSGSFLDLKNISVDCDADALLLQVEPTGPVCHTGNNSCFFQELDSLDAAQDRPKDADPPKADQAALPELHMVEELFAVIEERKRVKPQGSYVASLLEQGIDRIGKKVIEEAGETVIAAKNPEDDPFLREMADLWFHSLVLLSARGLTPEDVWQVLRERRR